MAPAAGEPAATSPEGAAPQLLFDIDEPEVLSYALSNGLTVGGEVDTEFSFLGNPDLDSGESDDDANLTPTLSVALSYLPAATFHAYLELQLEYSEDFGSSASTGVNEPRFLVDEAYLTYRELLAGVALRVGRDRVRDPREWLLDEELDGVRVFGRWGAFGTEFGVNRFRLFDEDLLNGESRERITNYLAIARFEPSADLKGRAYVLARDNQAPSSDDLLFFGVQGSAQIDDQFDIWLDAAHVAGQQDGVDVSGFGFDVGAVFAPDLPLRPSGTLGFAFGTGDDDPDDGHDHAFRQTGLQENQDAFNGVTRFLYYGEAFDPELSNMAILTAGVGTRPSDLTSIDLVYHRYWQHRRSSFLGDSALEAEPDGSSSHLGDEIDLIVGVSELDDVDLEMTFGVFFPGAAFGDNRDPAISASVELAVEF